MGDSVTIGTGRTGYHILICPCGIPCFLSGMGNFFGRGTNYFFLVISDQSKIIRVFRIRQKCGICDLIIFPAVCIEDQFSAGICQIQNSGLGSFCQPHLIDQTDRQTFVVEGLCIIRNVDWQCNIRHMHGNCLISICISGNFDHNIGNNDSLTLV